ncbi:hypothetical protein [Promicromonospora panici]|uniref:hypothetical protein n=1 Tax=Promicromonospora panici TaxID=2219658 RepID=UPI0030F47F32
MSASAALPGGGGAADGGRPVLDAQVVAGLRDVLAEGILPGATDTAAAVSKETLTAWVDLLGEVEKVKHTAAAVQARVAVALDEATRASEEKQGIRKERRGRGVPSQVGAAMGSRRMPVPRSWGTPGCGSSRCRGRSRRCAPGR